MTKVRNDETDVGQYWKSDHQDKDVKIERVVQISLMKIKFIFN